MVAFNRHSHCVPNAQTHVTAGYAVIHVDLIVTKYHRKIVRDAIY